MTPRVVYWVPDTATPSWGVGLLYEHVRLLRTRSVEAWCLGSTGELRSWLAADFEEYWLHTTLERLRTEDVVVVPEVSFNEVLSTRCPSRLVLFVQGTAPLLNGIPHPDSLHTALESERLAATLTILPHLQQQLKTLYGVKAELVPPFVLPAFFRSLKDGPTRQQRVLVHIKSAVEQTGIPGLEVLERLWSSRAPRGWTLERLEGLDQLAVAERMQSSCALVNLNLVEAFNTTVPESMAAECPVFCYEAVGGRDFLVSAGAQQNAFVVPTADIAGLCARLFDIIESWDDADTRRTLERVRSQGLATARSFTPERTLDSLHSSLEPFLTS